MKIKSLLSKDTNKKNYSKKILLVVSGILILFCLYQILIPLPIKTKIQDMLFKESKKTYTNLVSDIGIIHDNSLPKINLHIKKENWDKIAENRKLALNNWVPGLDRQVMIKTNEDWVGCKIELSDGIKIDAKTRLKGRLIDHWGENEYWSLNITLKGEHTFLGMKEFSIQHPKTRGFAVEWLFHQLLKKSKLISLRYGFCYVSINGAPERIYAYEEGLEKRLIENNQLREGPILKLNTDYNWFYGNLNNINFSNTNIEAYDDKAIQNSDEQKKLVALAIEKIDAFRNKKNVTSESFDSKKWATFFALLDWLGHDHAGHYDNARFYMNPITTLLEPIGRDYQTLLNISEKPLIGEFKKTDKAFSENWYECFFQDKVFMADYLKALEQISKMNFNLETFESLRTDLDKEFLRLKAHDLFAEPDPKAIIKILENNRKVIDEKLHQSRKRIFAYINPLNKSVEINLHNADTLPLILESISIGEKTIYKWPEEIWLEAYQKNKSPIYLQLMIPEISPALLLQSNQEVLIKFKYPGTQISFYEPLLTHPSGAPTLAFDKSKPQTNFTDFPFIKVDKVKKEIHFSAGEYLISKPLYFPEGYRVTSDLPLTLDIINKSFIHSKSAFFFVGLQDSIIKIISSDKSGGILILNTNKESQFQYVEFENLNTISNQNLNLTGAITFYEAPVTFKNCQFSQNHCEDYVNIFRSAFQLIQCKFEKSYGDAFDGDFVTGKIEESTFNKSGNDAIDISGSKIAVTLTKIDGAGDKGISVGEKSFLNGNKINFENCEIGLASKDSSEAILSDISISKSHLGFTAYQKKPEFSFASIKIEKLKMIDVIVPYLRENQSIISVDRKLIPVADKKVKELLYGIEFGKKSQ